MRAITIGDRTYRVIVTPRDGNWIARAEHTDSNDPFGVECSGATETAAVERLIEWLTWQRFSTQDVDCLSRQNSFVREGNCFLQRARRAAETSHLLIVNHALLLADIASGGSALPTLVTLYLRWRISANLSAIPLSKPARPMSAKLWPGVCGSSTPE